jgi:hypothetical protein
VVAYAQWAGAYATAGQLIILGSQDPAQAGTQGLETLFHEGMHQWDNATDRAIRETARKSGRKIPTSLSHSLIFYSAGYAVTKVVPDHRPYVVANGLWDNRVLVDEEKLDRFWRPYLDRKSSFDEAMESLLAALAA